MPYSRIPLCAAPSTGAPSSGPLDEGPCLLTAAVEAAQGVLWPESDEPRALHGVRSTQYRRLERTAVLLGLRSEGDHLMRSAAALAVPFLELRDYARAFEATVHSVVRGRVILNVLRRTRFARLPADTLVHAGHAAGLWKASRFDPGDAHRLGILRPLY